MQVRRERGADVQRRCAVLSVQDGACSEDRSRAGEGRVQGADYGRGRLTD